MKVSKFFGLLLLSMVILALLAACGSEPTGSLEFRANGEDFVRQGFVSKDGWNINFDNVVVTLEEVKAYQTDPPYDPHESNNVENTQTEVDLGGPFTVDLAEGGADADTILVGTVDEAPAGHYNAISWLMVPDASGNSLVIAGTAEKDGQEIDFTINIDQAFGFACGDYVGDARKGILDENGNADLEMTFHFDHIFGDADTPADDDLNMGAPGFDPFANAANGGTLEMSLSDLQSALTSEDYQMLVDVLPSLGHVGEGHCSYNAG